jgi:Inner membrane protein YgaP-like, transmembrane domain
MAAEPNIAGMARLLYIVAGVGLASWGLWGADPGWTQWTWLILGGAVLVLGLIGYSPVHAFLAKKE